MTIVIAIGAGALLCYSIFVFPHLLAATPDNRDILIMDAGRETGSVNQSVKADDTENVTEIPLEQINIDDEMDSEAQAKMRQLEAIAMQLEKNSETGGRFSCLVILTKYELFFRRFNETGEPSPCLTFAL